MDKKKATIALWRYTENERNYPGYHLTADAAGCRELEEGISAITRGGSTRALFELSPVTQAILNIPNNNRGHAACVYFAKLQVRQSRNSEESFLLSEESGICTLSASTAQLELLLAGIRDIARGHGDYSIGGEQRDQSLWFWWFRAKETMEPKE